MEDNTENRKFFLAQFLIEVDLVRRRIDTEEALAEYLFSCLKLVGRDRADSLTIYLMAAMDPTYRAKRYDETYEYRGFKIEILQTAPSVGTAQPEYLAFVTNLQ